ncbi:hypothetical protein Clacol_009733 [Clathrus columnatus]|uniref:DUF6699 domain-containing protein n=1 Tax=Clathrus columnatus TaxID=1419009 RepID=A0AAV5ARR0_9AGAM|nr:hypothetical protein Clacol_009733 [Clathrus columnatus]
MTSSAYAPSPTTSAWSTPQTSYSTRSYSRPRPRIRRRPSATPRSNVLRFIDSWGYNHPKTRAPQPQQRPPGVHALLGREGPLDYDLSLDPSHILVIHSPPSTGYSALSRNQLDAPATNPPVQSMSIVCDALPWTMTISASDGYTLTVRDVIEGLYRGLRSKAKKEDWERLRSTTARRRVRRAWISRYNRHHSFRDRAYEESQGLRSVDFLGGSLAFKGLTFMPDEQHWLMHVNPPKRRVKFSANSELI